MRIATIASIFSSGSGPGAPGVVQNVVASAFAPGDVSVTWGAPVSDGGSAITSYEVQYSSNSGSTWSNSTAPISNLATTISAPTLTIGTAYVFRVRAVNAIGSGPYSPATSLVTVASTPVVSSSSATESTVTPVVVTSSATTQTFSTINNVVFTSSGTWTNPYPAGATTGTATISGTTTAGVLDYVYGTTNGGPYNSTSSNGSLTGLTRNTTYYTKARGTNSSCSAAASATVDPQGSSTTVIFEYGSSSGVYTGSVTAAQSPLTGATPQGVTASVSLAAGTWYIRVKATNSLGTKYGSEVSVSVSNKVVYGSQLSFTPPAVTAIETLVAVGGGGACGYSGGGGGEYKTASSLSVGSSVTVTIGAGAALGVPGTSATSTSIVGTQTLAAVGGGDGYYTVGGTSGNGYAGGAGNEFFSTGGGGGGGAGGVGTAAQYISGSYYGGNGGAAVNGYGGGGGGVGSNALQHGSPKGDGPANTGRGGGAGRTDMYDQAYANGGSGYASFKYKGP